MNGKRRDDLDSMLDAALRDYSNREPGMAFDQRIVMRVRSGPGTRRSSWWIGWVLAPVSVSVAAIVLSVIASYNGRQPKPVVQPLPQVARVTSLPVLPPIPMVGTAATRNTEVPRRERLPEPETLTDGERALLYFVRSNPEQASELFADSGQMKELTIDPLKIEALP